MNQTDTYLKKHGGDVVQFAQELVRIGSVHGNEREVAEVIAKKLRNHGIKSRIIGPRGDRKSLVADIGKGQKTLMLNGHLDTVPIGNEKKWQFAPLSGRVSGGKLYGRGSMDMKSSIAAAVFAAISLVETGSKLNGRLRLLFNFDEESGVHTGVKDALDRGISANAAIVCEPMSDRVVNIGAKGIYRFELIVYGKTGHTGSVKNKGINAVTKMAKLLLALEHLKPKYTKHPLFTAPLIIPGTVISGGTAINVYPDECKALVDCRLTYGQSKAILLREIRECLAKEKQRDKSIKYTIRDLTMVPPVLTEKTDPIVLSTQQAFKEIAGFNPKLLTINGVTDGNILCRTGIPCVVFGVQGGNIHSENEFALIQSIKLMPRLYIAVAADYLESEG